MTQSLFLVFGGELTDPEKTEFRSPEEIHVVGVFADEGAARDAWKAEAQRTVDNAHMRYFVADLGQAIEAAAHPGRDGKP